MRRPKMRSAARARLGMPNIKEAMATLAFHDVMAKMGDLPRERLVELYVRCVELLTASK